MARPSNNLREVLSRTSLDDLWTLMAQAVRASGKSVGSLNGHSAQCIKVTIGPRTAYLTLSKGSAELTPAKNMALHRLRTEPIFSITLASEDDFSLLVAGHLSVARALLTRRLRYSGDRSLLSQLTPFFRSVALTMSERLLGSASKASTSVTDPGNFREQLEYVLKENHKLQRKVNALELLIEGQEALILNGESEAIALSLYYLLRGPFLKACLAVICLYLYLNGYTTAFLSSMTLMFLIRILLVADYFSLFRRQVVVYALAVRVYLTYKLAKIRARRLLDEQKGDNLMERVHRTQANLLYQKALELQGFWLKLGQYLSGRADVMPPAYIRLLKKLQDSVPARPFDVVRTTVEDELGRKLEEIFSHFENEPIAAASIAQVHVAYLKDKKKVAVKVQHPEIALLLAQDMKNMEKIFRWVSWLERGFDFGQIVKEWSEAVAKELDFKAEADATKFVGERLKESGINATTVHVLEALSTSKVMVMTFIEGMKISECLELESKERHQLVGDIIESFAYQIFVAGLFNADPHPGNIMVLRNYKVDGTDCPEYKPSSRGSSSPKMYTPVLLDFGLSRQMDDDKRLAFAQMLWAAYETDFASLLESFNAMGLKRSTSHPLQDIESLQYLFRDSLPAQEARDQFRALAAERRRERKQRKAAGQPKVVIEAWPGEIFVKWALHALSLKCEAARRSVALSPPRALSPDLSLLEAVVKKLLNDLSSSSDDPSGGLGLQVCVYKDGKKVVDCCNGILGPFNPLSLSTETKFNLFQIAGGISSLFLLKSALSRGLGLDTPIERFVTQAKRALPSKRESINEQWIRKLLPARTLREFLNRSCGYEHQTLGGVRNIPLHEYGKWRHWLRRMVEERDKVEDKGGAASKRKVCYEFQHLSVSWSWLFSLLLDELSGVSFSRSLEDELLGPLILSGGISYGRPSDDKAVAKTFMDITSFRHESESQNSYEGEGSREPKRNITRGATSIADLFGGGPETTVLPELHESETLLLDPRVFNLQDLQEQELAGVNCQATARALARLYSLLCGPLESSAMPKNLADLIIEGPKKDLPCLLGNDVSYSLGHRLFSVKGSDGRIRSIFGNTAIGGSVVLCDPSHNLSMAVLVNRVSIGGANPACNVAQAVYKFLGCGSLLDNF